MQSCLLTEEEINQHLREKRSTLKEKGSTLRTKRSPDISLNNHLVEFKLDSFSGSKLGKVNSNFAKLFSGQSTILDDLARLTVSIEALTSKEKTEEENLTKIRASLLYMNSETRLFTIFNQHKLINQNLIDMTNG